MLDSHHLFPVYYPCRPPQVENYTEPSQYETLAPSDNYHNGEGTDRKRT